MAKHKKKTKKQKRRKNPWGESSFDSLDKRIKKLCRNTDLSPAEISDSMDVPLGWVEQACRPWKNNPDSQGMYEALLAAMENGSPGVYEDNVHILRVFVGLVKSDASSETIERAIEDIANLIEDNYNPNH